jgi:hypothetical protein
MQTALDSHSLSDDHRGFATGTFIYKFGRYNAFLMNGLVRIVSARTEPKPNVKARAPGAPTLDQKKDNRICLAGLLPMAREYRSEYPLLAESVADRVSRKSSLREMQIDSSMPDIGVAEQR